MVKSSKGSSFERDVCRKLSKWVLGEDTEKVIFWRQQTSGASHTIAMKKGRKKEDISHLSGDIVAICDEGKWFTDFISVECKNGYSQISLDKHLKMTKNNLLQDFWLQSCRDAEQSNKTPIVIYKKLGMTPWLFVPNEIALFFMNDRFENVPFLSVRTIPNDNDCAKFKLDLVKLKEKQLTTFFIFDFNQFLNIISAEDLKRFIETQKV